MSSACTDKLAGVMREHTMDLSLDNNPPHRCLQGGMSTITTGMQCWLASQAQAHTGYIATYAKARGKALRVGMHQHLAERPLSNGLPPRAPVPNTMGYPRISKMRAQQQIMQPAVQVYRGGLLGARMRLGKWSHFNCMAGQPGMQARLGHASITALIHGTQDDECQVDETAAPL